jgi:PAS domain S-box-containing protein
LPSFVESSAFTAEQPAVAAIDVLQIITDSVICTDASGHILLFNRAAEKSFGYSAAEMLGESINILLPERHRAQHANDVETFGLRAGTSNRLMGEQRDVWGRRKNGVEFAAEATISRHSLDGRTILTVVHRDVTVRKELEEQRETIAHELDHRIKNVISVVSALVTLTAKSASSVEQLRDSIQQRLSGLAATQRLLARSSGQSVEFAELLGAELAPYRSSDGTNVSISGTPVTLRTSAVQPLALVIHELATNCAKYGAFSQPSGRVTITAESNALSDSRQLVIEWREAGGPLVRTPDRQGFGSRLIEQMVKKVFLGEVTFDFRPEGLICRMVIPTAALENHS